MQITARAPPGSHSLRRLLHHVCWDAQVSMDALRALERAVRPLERNLQLWHATILAVGHDVVLRALLALVDNAETGPVTATFIRNAYAKMLERRARRAAESTHEARAARERQAWLANVFENDANVSTTGASLPETD